MNFHHLWNTSVKYMTGVGGGGNKNPNSLNSSGLDSNDYPHFPMDVFWFFLKQAS